jgi:phage baseplate assembly protein W
MNTTQLAGYPLDQFVLMSRHTGTSIYDTDHLRQSIIDILTTPIGSRVMRRDYGSNLFKLLDRNVDRFLPIQLINATATAIRKWEPRVSITRVVIQKINVLDGVILIDIYGTYRLEGGPLVLRDLSLDFFAQNHQLIKTDVRQ